MAGYGTKKIFGDRGLQLTFPLEFQKAYNLPLAYFPSHQGAAQDVMAGSDFQSQYHQEKRAYANKTVMDGLVARRSAEQKLLTGPHNYHVPKPVLGQRVYANPSYGNTSIASGRRDSGAADAPFKVVENGGMMRGSGGLKTVEARQFYKDQLTRRIGQLDRLNALSQGFAVEMGQPYERHDNRQSGPPNKVEFFIYLRALGDTILSGDLSRFTFENVKELITRLLQLGPTASREDFQDILDALDTMTTTARDGMLEDPEFAEKPDNMAYATTLVDYLERMRAYVVEMFKYVNDDAKTRAAISKGMMKRIPTPNGEVDGFEKMLKMSIPERIRDGASGRVSVRSGLRNRMEDFDGFFGGDDDDGSGDGGGGGGDSWFGMAAPAREDEEARGIPRAPFAGRAGDPARERFGRDTGRRTRGEASFYGEDGESVAPSARLDADPYLAYPLGASGFDPNALGATPADSGAFKRAVEQEVGSVLRPLGFSGDVEDVDEFVAAQYPDPSNFVREVARGLEEKTFTPAQIARGMELLDLEVFNDYVAENTGDVGPAPALPARSNLGGLGGPADLGVPIYRPVRQGSITTSAAEGGGYASEADWAELTALGFPRSMDGMAAFTTTPQISSLMKKLPDKWGGPVNIRPTTIRKHAMATVRKYFKRIDPSW